MNTLHWLLQSIGNNEIEYHKCLLVFASVHKCLQFLQMFKCLPMNTLHWLICKGSATEVKCLKYLKIFSNVYKCLLMFTNDHIALAEDQQQRGKMSQRANAMRVFTNIFKCLHISTNVFKWLQIFTLF